MQVEQRVEERHLQTRCPEAEHAPSNKRTIGGYRVCGAHCSGKQFDARRLQAIAVTQVQVTAHSVNFQQLGEGDVSGFQTSSARFLPQRSAEEFIPFKISCALSLQYLVEHPPCHHLSAAVGKALSATGIARSLHKATQHVPQPAVATPATPPFAPLPNAIKVNSCFYSGRALVLTRSPPRPLNWRGFRLKHINTKHI